jgi:putative hydrolases of HD superfamily
MSISAAPAASKRTFPSLYTTSGDEAVDRLAFFHLLEKLKVLSVVLDQFRCHEVI